MSLDQGAHTATTGLHHPFHPVASFCQPGRSQSVAVVYMTIYMSAYFLLQPTEYKPTDGIS